MSEFQLRLSKFVKSTNLKVRYLKIFDVIMILVVKHIYFALCYQQSSREKSIIAFQFICIFQYMARFSCASFSQKSSTFMFHGDPRVWDGVTIKKTVKGDSVLYIILEDDEVCLCHLTQCIMLGVCSHAELRPFKHEFFCNTVQKATILYLDIYIFLSAS